jgi:hypothetical protein
MGLRGAVFFRLAAVRFVLGLERQDSADEQDQAGGHE